MAHLSIGSTGTSSARATTRGKVYPYETVMALQAGPHLGIPPPIKARIDMVKSLVPASKPGSWRTNAKPSIARPVPGARSTILKSTAEISIDDKIIEKVQGKINKMDERTYGGILAWINENFDPSNGVLTSRIVQLIFEKAVREEMFCFLFAKMLRDLSTKFTISSFIEHRFREFPKILESAHESVDVKDAAAETEEFIRLTSEKKYRRGYALLVGELFNQEMIKSTELIATLELIINNLIKSSETESNVSEEYVNCIQRIFQGSHYKLADVDGCTEQINRIKKLQTERSKYPGFTDKAYFATLDFMTTYDAYLSDNDSRKAVIAAVAAILAGYTQSDKSALEEYVNDIMDCMGESSPQFKSSVAGHMEQLRKIVELPASKTPGLSVVHRSKLASIFRI